MSTTGTVSGVGLPLHALEKFPWLVHHTRRGKLPKQPIKPQRRAGLEDVPSCLTGVNSAELPKLLLNKQ